MEKVCKISGESISEFGLLKKAPKELWYKGDLSLLDRRKVSIVGTRRPNSYTKSIVHRLSRSLASRGIVTVSGAAMGVDAIAHTGAGENNTIAVVATGLDIRYPAINASLIEKIENSGLVLSQFPMGTKGARWNFVIRNELVVALGEVLIIAEADINSGSIRSAEYALKQNKDIFVLPHRLGESEGTFELLKRGDAKLIYDIDSFADSFGEDIKENNIIEKDEFYYFCQKNPTLDEAILKFGDKIYEAELDGKIFIENGKVSVAL